jgi:hypothetical protein
MEELLVLVVTCFGSGGDLLRLDVHICTAFEASNHRVLQNFVVERLMICYRSMFHRRAGFQRENLPGRVITIRAGCLSKTI